MYVLCPVWIKYTGTNKYGRKKRSIIGNQVETRYAFVHENAEARSFINVLLRAFAFTYNIMVYCFFHYICIRNLKIVRKYFEFIFYFGSLHRYLYSCISGFYHS
jgi:hypothetical protein